MKNKKEIRNYIEAIKKRNDLSSMQSEDMLRILKWILDEDEDLKEVNN